MDTVSSNDAALRDREERLRSAKKKLKSYRAKQAQLGQTRRSSRIGSIGSVADSIASTSFDSPARQCVTLHSAASIKEKRRSRPLSGLNQSHGRSHSRNNSISVRDSTILFASPAPVDKSPVQMAKARTSTQSASLGRNHSRNGSRSLSMSKRGRPTSFTSPSGSTTKVVNEQPTDSWADLDESSLHTPTPNDFNDRFVDETSESTPLARVINPSRSLGSVNRPNVPSSSVATRVLAPLNTTPETGHERRKSRHSRKDSVSTRRESMEIMGGVHSMHVNPALQSNDEPSAPSSFAQRKSRRISSHRWSGLQAASVLFGGSPEPGHGTDKRTSGMDWRSAFGALVIPENDTGSRESALDKLEGRLKAEVSHSSVQLPSFDEVHGASGMDKRASLDLIESNVKTTSSDRSTLASVPLAASSSQFDTAALDLGTGESCLGGEALGTLMEEEEEEEDISSPVRETSASSHTKADSDVRRRTEAEHEVVKRTRRTSLQPAPLKLKSRPASLFIAPRPPSSTIATLGTTSSINSGNRADNFEFDEPTFTKDLTEMTPAEIHRKLAAARLAGALPDAEDRTPIKAAVSDDQKRAWRASTPTATAQSESNTPSSSTTPSRSGIRPLRLADNLQHRTAESSSSLASSASAAVASTNSGQSPVLSRASLILGSTPTKRSSIGYNTSLREEVGTPTKVSRRSSIQYRTSDVLGLDVAESSTGDSVTALTSPTRSTISHSGGVPMGVFEELKSKHQRDITLLDESRKNITRLEAELISETERSRREYSELERWSAEEKRALGQRIEHLEANIVEITQVREAREEHHQRLLADEQDKQKALQTRLEDAESERDMLRDDVEGWRARCKDLEGTLRNAQPSLSPMLRAISRDGSVSPILDADVAPPPQAIKLLKDMRQQIMSLARLLEQERDDHARTRQLLQPDSQVTIERDVNDGSIFDVSSALNSFVTESSSVQHHDDTSIANTTIPSSSSLERLAASFKPNNAPAHHADMQSVTVQSPQRQSFASAPKRNHVSAYDSSMESGKRSASVASVSTQQTSEYHVEGGLESPLHSAASGAKSTTISMGELDPSHVETVGLGVEALDTVAEEEEALTEQAEVASTVTTAAPPSIVHSNKQQHSSLDVDSAGRPSDLESVAPPTPALDHYSPQHLSKNLSPTVHEGNRVAHQVAFDDSVSSSASIDLATSVPPSSHASQDTIVTPAMDNEAASFAGTTYSRIDDSFDDDDEDLPPPPAPRPEFIREWSFERAMFAAQNSPQTRKARPQLRIGIQSRTPVQRSRKQMNMSIDDFFGIMNIDDERTLPALPTPDEALEMPPLQLMSGGDPYSPRGASNVARQSRISSSAIRPPVAKTSRAYGQPMMTRAINSQIGRANGGGGYSAQRTVSQPITSQSAAGSIGGEGASYAGAGMFSRVVSLTSAFGGYFTGSANSESHDTSYSPNGYARNHIDAEAGGPRHDSVSWSVARRVDVEEA